MSSTKTHRKGPRDLIANSPLSFREMASKGGINKDTIVRCKRKNAWPKQIRVLNGLRRALGLAEVTK